MILGILQSGRKSKIVKIGLKNAFLCKFLDEKRSVPKSRTDLWKHFVVVEEIMCSTNISLSKFSLTTAMQKLMFEMNIDYII